MAKPVWGYDTPSTVPFLREKDPFLSAWKLTLYLPPQDLMGEHMPGLTFAPQPCGRRGVEEPGFLHSRGRRDWLGREPLPTVGSGCHSELFCLAADPQAGSSPTLPCSPTPGWPNTSIASVIGASALYLKITFLGGEPPAQHRGPEGLPGLVETSRVQTVHPAAFGMGAGRRGKKPSELQGGSPLLLPEPPPRPSARRGRASGR